MNRRGLKLICQNFITPMCMLFLNVLFIAKHALRNQNQSHQTPMCVQTCTLRHLFVSVTSLKEEGCAIANFPLPIRF